MQKNRVDDGLIPFVKNRDGEHCPFVTIVLLRQSNGTYHLSSAWIGVIDDMPFP